MRQSGKLQVKKPWAQNILDHSNKKKHCWPFVLQKTFFTPQICLTDLLVSYGPTNRITGKGARRAISSKKDPNFQVSDLVYEVDLSYSLHLSRQVLLLFIMMMMIIIILTIRKVRQASNVHSVRTNFCLRHSVRMSLGVCPGPSPKF